MKKRGISNPLCCRTPGIHGPTKQYRMNTPAMMTSAMPAARRVNSSSSRVPPSPTTTSHVVHCAPARNSSPSISTVMYAAQPSEASTSSQSYHGTPVRSLRWNAVYSMKPIAPPQPTWMARNISGSSEYRLRTTR